jgi:hypothetical protein
MTSPSGTFLATVRAGAIRFPPPIKAYCDSEHWDLFRVAEADHDHLILEPVIGSDIGSDTDTDSCSSLSPDGQLWIPAALRDSVALAEQSVMIRVENGTIGIYLRKVFDTLGFRP